MDKVDLEFELLWEAHERNHDFGTNFDASGLNLGRSLKYRACLHFRDFRIDNAQATTAMSKHRIELVKLFDTACNAVYRNSELFS